MPEAVDVGFRNEALTVVPLFRLRHERRLSLAAQIEALLRRAIIEGELRAGTRLVELEIAREAGTSQAPVREALQRLEQDGLVERKSRTATFVTPIAWEEMHDIFLVRTMVEGLASRRVAECITAAQCTQLQRLLAEMHVAGLANDIRGVVATDMTFHRLILEWSDNATLLRIWTPLYAQLHRMLVTTHPYFFPSLDEVAETHRPVVEALIAHDPERAAQAMQDHIMLIWTGMLREDLDKLKKLTAPDAAPATLPDPMRSSPAPEEV